MDVWNKLIPGALRRRVRLLDRRAWGESVASGSLEHGAPASRRTERMTLTLDPRRAQSYRVAVAAPSIWSDRPFERGWGRPSLLFEHLVVNMGVPGPLAAEKVTELERTGGPVSFDLRG